MRQLEEIIALKDRANKDLKDNVKHLENALAETKMNLEFMHSKWRDEAAAHEQVLDEMTVQSARLAHLEDEHRRQREREADANVRVAAARSEALDRVQELQELHLRHGSNLTAYEKHKGVHAMIKERMGRRLVALSDKGIKNLCFTHWLGRMDESRLKSQLVRALEKNWMSRRLLLWRHQRESFSAHQMSEQMHVDRQKMEDKLAELEESRDAAMAKVTVTEVALSEARESLEKTLVYHADTVEENESLAAQLRAYKARESREDELEAELKQVRFELRVVEEELRLSHDFTQTVRLQEVSALDEVGRRKGMQARIDAACNELDVGDVPPEERLNVLIVLATRCWTAQRDRDGAIELRQSLARQVADLTEQLALLEEENALLRNIGMSLEPTSVRGVSVDELEDKDRAISVLTQRARELEKKMEALNADLHKSVGHLVVTVLRARDLPQSMDKRAPDPFVNVKVDKRSYKTQVRKSTDSPEWNEEFVFSVSAETKEMLLTVSDWGNGEGESTMASAVVMLSDLNFSLNQPHHAWVPLARVVAAEDEGSSMIGDSPSEESADKTRHDLWSDQGAGCGAILLEIEYKGPLAATPRGRVISEIGY